MDAGQRAQGEALLRPLMQARGFYPMAAAEALGERYVINVAREPAIARVRELMYWNMEIWRAANGARWWPAAAGRNRSSWRGMRFCSNSRI